MKTLFNKGKMYFMLMIIISFLLLNGFKQQGKEDKIIIWSSEYKLKWEDFQGKALSSSINSAISNVGLNPQYKNENGMLKVSIEATFNKKLSWVKSERKTDSALAHEQGHFDIAEIHARKMRKAFKETKFTTKSAKKRINNLTAQISKELTKYHELYDEETNHHINKIKQQEWEERIKKELKELESYSESIFTVAIK